MKALLSKDAWSIIRSAYIAGATVNELSTAHNISRGTIFSRASREKWSAERPTAKPAQAEVAQVKAANATIWAEREEESKTDWHKITSRVRKVLVDAPEAEILARADKVKLINEIERKNLGMDKETPASAFTVGIQLVGAAAAY